MSFTCTNPSAPFSNPTKIPNEVTPVICASKGSPTNAVMYSVIFKSVTSRSVCVAFCSVSEQCSTAFTRNSVSFSRSDLLFCFVSASFISRCTIKSGYLLMGDVKCV